jgi:hypothetical protein
MIRRLLCLFGFHKWHTTKIYERVSGYTGCLEFAKVREITRCQYCGKEKKEQ